MRQNEVLSVKNLKKSFGNISVLEDVNFSLYEGEFKTIIGPNGAGKTTLYNIISGVMKPNGGEVYFKGNNITRMSTHKITNMGLSRSFQITNLFPDLTVHENVRLAVQAKGQGNFNIFKGYTRHKEHIAKTDEILESVRLSDKPFLLARDLTHTEKRKLELGIVLGMGGDVIMLDEPTAGVAAEEVPELFKIILEIKEKKEKSILLIEHKMGIVLGFSDTIAVLSNGIMIADGTPEEIQSSEKVQEVYLGGGQTNE
ncbi:MAG: ABC transporter ATP-binding protein [Oscillospiraceae bacterium]|nr:ABC transporter ATP-binding protein [Oscillospiraceae bacterium]